MNSRQYERQQLEHLRQVLEAAGISEYRSCCLSADRTKYEITLVTGEQRVIASGFERLED